MKATLLTIGLLAASCSPRPTSGVRVEAGRSEVGARMYVDGRYAGTLQRMYWVVASPFDTLLGVATHRPQQADSSDYTSWLNAMVRGGKQRSILSACTAKACRRPRIWATALRSTSSSRRNRSESQQCGSQDH